MTSRWRPGQETDLPRRSVAVADRTRAARCPVPCSPGELLLELLDQDPEIPPTRGKKQGKRTPGLSPRRDQSRLNLSSGLRGDRVTVEPCGGIGGERAESSYTRGSSRRGISQAGGRRGERLACRRVNATATRLPQLFNANEHAATFPNSILLGADRYQGKERAAPAFEQRFVK